MEDKQYFWNLFVYGSLTSKDIIKKLITRIPKTKKAFLKGWKKILEPCFFPYPFLIEDDLSEVEGLCYFDLSEEEIDKIDRYESCDQGLYMRRKIMIQLTTIKEEKEVEAEVYVGDILVKEYKEYLQNQKKLKESRGYK